MPPRGAPWLGWLGPLRRLSAGSLSPLSAGLLLTALALALGGCHSMRFALTEEAAAKAATVKPVYERKSFWVGGLAPTLEVDVSQHCPNGAYVVREQTTALDGFLGALTLGIWVPRSSWYYCRPDVAAPPPPPLAPEERFPPPVEPLETDPDLEGEHQA